MDSLKTRFEQLIAGISDDELNTVFSTINQQELTDEYFLTSGDKIRFFLEEKAVGPEGKNFVSSPHFFFKGKLKIEKRLAINKIGHALYELDPVFKKFTGLPINVRIAKEVLGLQEPLVAQSMYICKQPHIGGAVNPHQDGSFLFTIPESVCALWFPVDDATRDNACLWAVPGSHKDALRTRMLSTKDKGILFDPPLKSITWPDSQDYVPVEVKKGSVVLIHGRVAHKSSENLSSQSRHAYTFHLIDGKTVWDSENWLQRPTKFPVLIDTSSQ